MRPLRAFIETDKTTGQARRIEPVRVAGFRD